MRRRPRIRGQDQQRLSRFPLLRRNNQYANWVMKYTTKLIGAGNTEEHRSDGDVALDACSRTSSATAVSFLFVTANARLRRLSLKTH